MRHLLVWCLLPVLMAFDGPLEDPAAEARAKTLMDEIRCVACENEPISQSGSDIAEDMRLRVREMIANGASDDEVRAWFAERYGEFVLFRPAHSGWSGKLLWGLPFGLLLAGAAGLIISRSRSKGQEVLVGIAPDVYDKENDKAIDTEL